MSIADPEPTRTSGAQGTRSPHSRRTIPARRRARSRDFSASLRRSAGQAARENCLRRRRRRKRPDLGHDDARPWFGDRQRRQSALGHEAANDAVVVAAGATSVFAALAGGGFMPRVLVMAAMIGVGLERSSSATGAGMRMPDAAERTSQHVANRYAAGSSAMVPARDHGARWPSRKRPQMQLSCMIIKTPPRQGQYKSDEKLVTIAPVLRLKPG